MIRLRSLALLLLACLSMAMAAPPQKTQSFWDRVLKFLGVSATPGNQKGEGDKVKAGDIWIVDLSTKVGSQVRAGTFRSPIFLPDNQTILALTGEKVVKIALPQGPVTELFTIPGIVKLVGVDSSAPDQVLVLTDLDQDNCPTVGILALSDGKVTNLPNDGGKDDLTLISHLKDWNREYDQGETRFEVRLRKRAQNGREIEWTDVFLKRKNKDWANVSRCDPGVNCSHPSISNDRKFVVFVRSA